MLAYPELRPRSARFPALYFGAGPALCWLAMFGVTTCTIRVLMLGSSPELESLRTATVGAAHAVGAFYLRVLPVVLAAVMLHVSRRQRALARWSIFGAILVSVLAGAFTLDLSDGSMDETLLGVNSPLAPLTSPLLTQLGANQVRIGLEGLARALVLSACSVLGCAVLSRVGAASVSNKPGGVS